jgi:predicted Rossmann fold flavoprotein
VRQRIRGSLLFTHFGISGPAALDMSRHWLRARLEGRATALTASVIPGLGFEQADAALRALTVAHPRTSVVRAMARLPGADGLPASVAGMVAVAAGVPADHTLAALTKAERRAVVHALTALPLPAIDSRGYNHAEVTAGGIALAEVDPAAMASRVCPGLFLAGEILDVDGRLGGFNFQWAWASARAAALGVTRSLA